MYGIGNGQGIDDDKLISIRCKNEKKQKLVGDWSRFDSKKKKDVPLCLLYIFSKLKRHYVAVLFKPSHESSLTVNVFKNTSPVLCTVMTAFFFLLVINSCCNDPVYVNTLVVPVYIYTMNNGVK